LRSGIRGWCVGISHRLSRPVAWRVLGQPQSRDTAQLGADHRWHLNDAATPSAWVHRGLPERDNGSLGKRGVRRQIGPRVRKDGEHNHHRVAGDRAAEEHRVHAVLGRQGRSVPARSSERLEDGRSGAPSYKQGSGTLVRGPAANKDTKAALALYPVAVVDRVVQVSNGEYEVHNRRQLAPPHLRRPELSGRGRRLAIPAQRPKDVYPREGRPELEQREVVGWEVTRASCLCWSSPFGEDPAPELIRGEASRVIARASGWCGYTCARVRRRSR
jgi:hypothetical protein